MGRGRLGPAPGGGTPWQHRCRRTNATGSGTRHVGTRPYTGAGETSWHVPGADVGLCPPRGRDRHRHAGRALAGFVWARGAGGTGKEQGEGNGWRRESRMGWERAGQALPSAGSTVGTAPPGQAGRARAPSCPKEAAAVPGRRGRPAELPGSAASKPAKGPLVPGARAPSTPGAGMARVGGGGRQLPAWPDAWHGHGTAQPGRGSKEAGQAAPACKGRWRCPQPQSPPWRQPSGLNRCPSAAEAAGAPAQVAGRSCAGTALPGASAAHILGCSAGLARQGRSWG